MYFHNLSIPKFGLDDVFRKKIDLGKLIFHEIITGPYLNFDFELGQNTNAPTAPTTAAEATTPLRRRRGLEVKNKWKNCKITEFK
jgi:hypothetical protein